MNLMNILTTYANEETTVVHMVRTIGLHVNTRENRNLCGCMLLIQNPE